MVLTLIIWEGNRLIDSYFKDIEDLYFWKRVAILFGGSALITTLSSLSLGATLLYYTGSTDTATWFVPLKLLLMFAFRVNLFLNTINVIFLYQKKLEHSREEIENYKRISSQAQLQSLKNQINPHFLFNNLSVLSELITVDSTASEEFVKQFAKVYRYVLNSHEKELVELKYELEFISSYSFLLKTRFSAGLHININVPSFSKEGFILPMAMQMLVENAIKHNVISRFKPLVLDIYEDDNGYLNVRNNLQKKQADDVESTKVGLNNIKKRYEHLGKKQIEIYQNEDEFRVAIPIIMLNQNNIQHSNLFKKSA